MEHQDSDAAAVAMAALDQPRQVLVPGNDQCRVKARSIFANQGLVVSFGFQNLAQHVLLALDSLPPKSSTTAPKLIQQVTQCGTKNRKRASAFGPEVLE